jgi:ParB/RepB/Spo0J family partition protein
MATRKANGKTEQPHTNAAALDVVEIPLDKIDVDANWNVRSGDFTQVKGEDSQDSGVSGFLELVESIKERGQDTPVDVVPAAKGRFKLITGFRRFQAIRTIAGMTNNANPTIIARNRGSIPESEQRLINLAENTLRSDLKASDQAFGLLQLKKAIKADTGKDISDNQLAAKAGLGQSYVSKLMRICSLKKDIVEHWRGSPDPVSVPKMLQVVALDPENREAEYKKLSGQDRGGSGNGSGGSKDITSLLDKCKKVGFQLGTLVRLGVVELLTDELPVEGLEVFASLPQGKKGELAQADKEARRECLKAARQGYAEGQKEPVEKKSKADKAAQADASAN